MKTLLIHTWQESVYSCTLIVTAGAKLHRHFTRINIMIRDLPVKEAGAGKVMEGGVTLYLGPLEIKRNYGWRYLA